MEPGAGSKVLATRGCTYACTYIHTYMHICVYNKHTHNNTCVHLCIYGYKYSQNRIYTYKCFCTTHEQSRDSHEKSAGFNWLMEILLGTFISSE